MSEIDDAKRYLKLIGFGWHDKDCEDGCYQKGDLTPGLSINDMAEILQRDRAERGEEKVIDLSNLKKKEHKCVVVGDCEPPPDDLGSMLERLAGMKQVGDIVMSWDAANRVWFISATDPAFEGMIYESSYELTPREAVEAAIKAVEKEQP